MKRPFWGPFCELPRGLFVCLPFETKTTYVPGSNKTFSGIFSKWSTTTHNLVLVMGDSGKIYPRENIMIFVRLDWNGNAVKVYLVFNQTEGPSLILLSDFTQAIFNTLNTQRRRPNLRPDMTLVIGKCAMVGLCLPNKHSKPPRKGLNTTNRIVRAIKAARRFRFQ